MSHQNTIHRPYPAVLTIAGSDCSGGAGVQADLKTISALKCYAASAITAITVQNTLGVKDIFPIPPAITEGQIRAVFDDIHPDTVKIGMVNDIDTVKTIAKTLNEYKKSEFAPEYIVYDPVMVSTSGYKLMNDDTIDVIKTYLIPIADVITPNLHEAAVLLGYMPKTVEEMKTAAVNLSDEFKTAVLVKGGHCEGDVMTDVLAVYQEGKTAEERLFCFSAKKIDSENTHGTGCTLSSAIASYLAKGLEMNEAIRKAKEYVHKGIESGRDLGIGHGHGPLWHMHTIQ